MSTALAKAALDNGIDATFEAGLELEISHAVITDEQANAWRRGAGSQPGKERA